MAVLVVSTLLNAGYFLPVLYAAWFQEPTAAWGERPRAHASLETGWMLLLPPLVTAAAALAAGLLAGLAASPLGWAELIVAREYGQ